MKMVALTMLPGLIVGCSTAAPNAYWDRPGAKLPQLASESESCYREAIGDDSPSALPSSAAASAPRLLPRSDPPPALWTRAPRQAAFEHYDEQARYERCMRGLGWTSVGSPPIRR